MHAFTSEDIAFHLRWRATSGHPSGWRVTREDFRDPPLLDPKFQQLTGPKGKLVLFKSRDTAKRRADKLNRGT